MKPAGGPYLTASGERRCQECGLFSRALGLAGTCLSCDEPILLTELLELE
jgi:hypothetical protein